MITLLIDSLNSEIIPVSQLRPIIVATIAKFPSLFAGETLMKELQIVNIA